MKRTGLIIAVVTAALGFSSPPSAVNINSQGLGEVLFFPYYSVNGGNDTVFTIYNTTGQVKAVDVSFLDSKNSKWMLDFNLYLAPFDSWTGVLTSVDSNGPAVLTTSDAPCTVPSLFGPGDGTLPDGRPYVELGTLLFSERILSTNALIDADPRRTREGHIQVVEMGIVNDVSPSFMPATAASLVNGVPVSCQTLVDGLFVSGPWASGNLDAGMDGPSGGLLGDGSIVNVVEGSQANYAAVAIEDFYSPTGAMANDSLHSFPGDTSPDLRLAQTGGLLDPVISVVPDGTGAIQTR